MSGVRCTSTTSTSTRHPASPRRTAETPSASWPMSAASSSAASVAISRSRETAAGTSPEVSPEPGCGARDRSAAFEPAAPVARGDALFLARGLVAVLFAVPFGGLVALLFGGLFAALFAVLLDVFVEVLFGRDVPEAVFGREPPVLFVPPLRVALRVPRVSAMGKPSGIAVRARAVKGSHPGPAYGRCGGPGRHAGAGTGAGPGRRAPAPTQ